MRSSRSSEHGRRPALDSLRSYSLPAFRADLLAGLTVAAVAVPQAMAYALIAGIPPVYGLYTAIVMTAVGALFDSSKQLINGPTNAISIALLSALSFVPEQDRPAVATVLALLIGLMQMGITFLRLGPAFLAGLPHGFGRLLCFLGDVSDLVFLPAGDPRLYRYDRPHRHP